MKYLVIPQTLNSDPLPGQGDPKPLSFVDYLRQAVWTSDAWSANLEMSALYQSIYAKFRNVKPGDVVELEDREYEQFMPLATMRGKQRPEPVSHLINMYAHSVLCAESVKPPVGSSLS